MNSVRVLLSLYNPNYNFYNELLISLKNQKNVEVKLSVRVDHIDQSENLKLLTKTFFPDVEWTGGSNIGPGNSFIELLKTCTKDCDYYAFADQDDVWEDQKLSTACRKITSSNNTNAYCSIVKFVDVNLNYIASSRVPNEISFHNAIVENVIYGCTLIVTKNLSERFLEKTPKKVQMHDAWLYLYIQAFDNLFFDKDSLIYYRQHSNNVIGSNVNKNYYINKLKKNFNTNLFKQRETAHLQDFYDLYRDNLSFKQKELLKIYIKSRSNLLLRFRALWIFSRNNVVDNLFLKIKILLGLI